MDYSKVLFRASGCSQLMVDPKSKSEPLSETTKTFLIGVMIKERYGRQKDTMNRYVQKGLMCEDDAITLFSRIRKQFFLKNETHLENDFLKGTPDLFEGNETILRATKIIDIKTSFDIFTFQKSKYDPINKDYYAQLQAYMDLTGATESELAYCLVNTPESIIEGLKRRFQWDAGIKGDEDFALEAFEEIEHLAKYDDIPLEEKVHIKIIHRDQDYIDKLHERVIIARQWMNANFN